MVDKITGINLFLSDRTIIRQSCMKSIEQPNMMGSASQSISLPPISLPPIQRPPSSNSRDLSKRSQSRLSQHTDHLPDSLITTLLDGHRTQFTLSPKSQELVIKCINLKTNKKFITHYKYDLLPKAIQVTYKSLEQLFEDIRYIVEENVSNRLAIGQDGKLVFSLETKKRGKSEFLPEVFDLQEESEERAVSRLEDEVARLKEEDSLKTLKITQLQKRITSLQKLIKPHQQQLLTSSQTQLPNNQPHSLAQFNTIHSPLTTIDVTSPADCVHNNLSQLSQSRLQEESVIRKFKRSQSNSTLQEMSQWQEGGLGERDKGKLLKAEIDEFDCFFELEEESVRLELLSRKHAKLYKCLITTQTIPKSVYSFIPTPSHLFDELSFIISREIPNRLAVVDTSFIYRASINAKDQEVLIDGVFETQPVEQNDLQRIEELIDIRTGRLETSVRELQLEVELLKVSLESNDIILERPQGFMDSKIVEGLAQFITLCRFFKSKIFKMSLLYRASENNFQVKKFHDRCDSIPNTLTLALTEFGKIIGGFTSEQWDRNGGGKSVSDFQSHSFIFSLTNRHKFSLQQHEHAIQTSGEDGPRFGNGADLVIKEKANENNNSYANICTSYTHPRYVYKNSESYRSFSGDEKTNRFGVREWQVFEVFFEE